MHILSAAEAKPLVSPSQKPAIPPTKPVPLTPELQRQVGGAGSPYTSPRGYW